MKKPRQEVIGAFTVIDNRQEIRKVVVSQDIVNHYDGNEPHLKRLNLEHADGVEVYKTSDPDIFKLPDGSILRKKSQVKP